MPKCDFNKVAKQLYSNHTSAWVFSCKFAANSMTPFPQNISGELLLYWELPVATAFLDVVFLRQYMHHLLRTRTRSILVDIFPGQKNTIIIVM